MKEAEKKKVDEIELRSEDFQEVLSDMPPWILRWGITTVATIVVIRSHLRLPLPVANRPQIL